MTGASIQQGRSGGAAVQRYPALDELRGGAVIAVIAYHSLVSTPAEAAATLDHVVNGVIMFLPNAIDLFFVISGCLITLILDRTREADHTIRTFYFRRALRIIPLYYALLLFAHIFLKYLGPTAFGPPGAAKWEWLLLTNVSLALHGPDGVGSLFPHFWSLAVEEHFYLVWPWLVILIRPQRMIVVCVALAAGSVAGRVILSFNGLAYASWLLTPTRLDGLALGSAVALFHVYRPEILQRWAIPARRWGLILLPVCILLLLIGVELSRLLSPEAHKQAVATATVVSPFFFSITFALVVAASVSRKKDGEPGPAGKLLRSIARCSYGMYAFHVPLIVILFHSGRIPQAHLIGGSQLPYRLLFSLAILTLSYTAGLLSWHLYEKQMLKLAPSYRYSARDKSPSPREGELQAIPVP